MKTIIAASIALFAFAGFATAQEAPGADGMTKNAHAVTATSSIDYTRTQSINSASGSTPQANFRWNENR